jgi:hypothetical protein
LHRIAVLEERKLLSVRAANRLCVVPTGFCRIMTVSEYPETPEKVIEKE